MTSRFTTAVQFLLLSLVLHASLCFSGEADEVAGYAGGETCLDRGCICGSQQNIAPSCFDDRIGRCCPGEPPQPANTRLDDQLQNIVDQIQDPNMRQRVQQTLAQAAREQQEVGEQEDANDLEHEYGLCTDMGCFCEEAQSERTIIPVACYSESRRCCPGEAPQHIKEHFANIRLGRGIETLQRTADQLQRLSECNKSDLDSDVAVCTDGLYQKVSEDSNTLPARLTTYINNNGENPFRDESRGSQAAEVTSGGDNSGAQGQ